MWWPIGARHFLEHLVDGDIASNNHGWQWVAGTGTDAAPYFRVFNPVTQGAEVRPRRRLRAALGARARATCPAPRRTSPGSTRTGYAHGYPERIVDHAAERLEALSRLEATKR